MRRSFKYAVAVLAAVLVVGCFLAILFLVRLGAPRLCSVSTDETGIHFGLKYTAGNWINPANYTDIISIPTGSEGVIIYSKVTATNLNSCSVDFDGGFVEYWKGKSVEFRLLNYRKGFDVYQQYLPNGKYKCR